MLSKAKMDQEELEQLRTEIDILRAATIKTKYVGRYIDTFETSRSVYVVQEYLDGANLLKFMVQGQRSEEQVKSVMRELCQGL